MRIYADENIERSIAEGLRRRGIDVLSARELGHLGKTDDYHLKKAAELRAVILTHDSDFLGMAASSGAKHYGIIFSHPKTVSVGECIRGVELIVTILTDREMKNHIEFI